MKIFLVSRGWPTPNDSQWGSFECDQAHSLKERGHEIIVANIDGRFRFKNRKYGLSYKNYDGIKVYTLGIFPALLIYKISNSLWLYIYQKIMVYLIEIIIKKEGKPDLFYAHYFTNITSIIPLKNVYNVPLVGMEHWSVMAYKTLPNYVKKWANKVYPQLDLLISVSPSLRDNLKYHFNVNSIVIGNTINKIFFNEALIEKKSLNKKQFDFISIGNLLPIKGFDLLLKAFYRSTLYKENVHLTIIGEGVERNKLEAMIKQLGLSNSVYLPGRKNREQILEYLQNSDAFISSSLSETFGVVYIEAMSQGLPVVGTKCGGPESFISEEEGILVSTNDVNALSQAMCEMYSNINKYNREIIRNKIINNFSLESVGLKLETEFKKLLISKK